MCPRGSLDTKERRKISVHLPPKIETIDKPLLSALSLDLPNFIIILIHVIYEIGTEFKLSHFDTKHNWQYLSNKITHKF